MLNEQKIDMVLSHLLNTKQINFAEGCRKRNYHSTEQIEEQLPITRPNSITVVATSNLAVTVSTVIIVSLTFRYHAHFVARPNYTLWWSVA